MGRLTENCVVTMKNKSFSITAELEVPWPASKCHHRQGGAFGGLSLYAKGGKAKFAYNLLGLKISNRSQPTDPMGNTRCAWSSPTTAAAWPKEGASTLYYDGQKVAKDASRRRSR